SKKESEDLYAIISKRQNDRRGRVDSMLSSLMSKYGGGEPSSEPSEEEFEAARKKIEIRKTSKNSKGLGFQDLTTRRLCLEDVLGVNSNINFRISRHKIETHTLGKVFL
ncbi:unnamed protein product, partial [Ilex paraguariensis]